MSKLVIIIPAYNEEATIATAISKTPKLNNRISSTEIIVIDDGSREFINRFEI